MKAAKAILLTMMVVLQGSVALCQITPTEKAAASGTCSTAHVGDNNAYNINCNGVGVDQGKKIVEMLNRVLANQDPTAVNAKLDELLVVASQPAQTQALQAPPNILGLTVTPLVPRPNIGADGLIEGPMGVNPGVTVTFTVDSMFTQAMFSVFCDRSCAATSASVEGTSSPKMLTTDKPNIAVVALGLTLMPNNKVTITVQSTLVRFLYKMSRASYSPYAKDMKHEHHEGSEHTVPRKIKLTKQYKPIGFGDRPDRLTAVGRKQLKAEQKNWRKITGAVALVLYFHLA